MTTESFTIDEVTIGTARHRLSWNVEPETDAVEEVVCYMLGFLSDKPVADQWVELYGMFSAPDDADATEWRLTLTTRPA